MIHYLKYLLIMELGFDAILYSKLGNGNSDAAVSNVHAGRIWPPGRRFPAPVLKSDVSASDHIKLIV